jgi:hypothetical protein
MLLMIREDTQIKVFAMLFFLAWESELRQQFQAMYDDQSPYAWLGSAQFRRLMPHVEENVRKTLAFPYHKYNVIEMVSNFTSAAREQYMMH